MIAAVASPALHARQSHVMAGLSCSQPIVQQKANRSGTGCGNVVIYPVTLALHSRPVSAQVVAQSTINLLGHGISSFHQRFGLGFGLGILPILISASVRKHTDTDEQSWARFFESYQNRCFGMIIVNRSRALRRRNWQNLHFSNPSPPTKDPV